MSYSVLFLMHVCPMHYQLYRRMITCCYFRVMSIIFHCVLRSRVCGEVQNERNKLTQREANLFSSDRCAWRQLMTSPRVRETAADVECGRVVSRSSTSVDSSQYTEQSFVGFPQSHARSRSLIRSKYGKPPSAWTEGREGQSTVVQIWPKDWLYQCAD